MKQVPLTQGAFALVDDEDEDLVSTYRWQLGGNDRRFPYATYVRHTTAGVVHIAMHRLVVAAEAGQIVDHRDGNGLNNTRGNLRICTYLENNRNRARYVRRKRESGGYLGVCLHRASGLWHAQIHAGPPMANGQASAISLRYFTDPESAARAYDAAARFYFGEFASVNFPEEEGPAFDPSLYGYRLRGSRNPSSKITDEAVRMIRQSNEPLRVVAARCGISITTASLIRRREAWKHVA